MSQATLREEGEVSIVARLESVSNGADLTGVGRNGFIRFRNGRGRQEIDGVFGVVLFTTAFAAEDVFTQPTPDGSLKVTAHLVEDRLADLAGQGGFMNPAVCLDRGFQNRVTRQHDEPEDAEHDDQFDESEAFSIAWHQKLPSEVRSTNWPAYSKRASPSWVIMRVVKVTDPRSSLESESELEMEFP